MRRLSARSGVQLKGICCLLSHDCKDSSQSNNTRFDDVECSVDDDGRHEELDKCLRLGGRFVKKYIKALGKSDETFDACESSTKYLTCIEPLLHRCPGIKHVMHNHWRNLTAYMKCACHDKRSECTKSLDCLSSEYRSLLVVRCNSLFSFNVRQNTKDHCHFLREAINCKDALITSQCGSETGQFAYHLLRLSNDDFVVKNRCHLPRNPTYKGFRYTDSNGRCEHFLPDMKSCVRENISRKQMLSFREDNDLVVEGGHSKKEIKDACSRYRKYESCMRPIRERCPAGPDLVYEIDSELRGYKLKMEYICKVAKKRKYSRRRRNENELLAPFRHQSDGYLPHVKCYNRIHTDGTLKQCNEHVWDDVATYLENVTSYQIYCQKELPVVKALKQELDKVRLCYEEVVSNECNKTASRTLSEFMKLVFRDPEYLKLGFVADCQLHRSAPQPIPAGSTSSTPRHRHDRYKTRRPPIVTTSTPRIYNGRGGSIATHHVTNSPNTPAQKHAANPERTTSGSDTPWQGVFRALTWCLGVSVALIT
ncbi:hypothetical protein LSH36_193g03004 [Paralvinella palmiformis]|uniref:Uncharacterized protein n=1 Tax=Paralvinella palmiformis TaxID=53620 RepID=A0AAD9JQ49_9ANNE|nr:hypothetical protein LSH36_193g03004 [Paralvinella palmiformis]